MAKESKIGWIKLGLTAFGMVILLITAFVLAQSDIKALDTKTDGIKEDAALLKEDGCRPSGKNTFNVGLMQKDITAIKDDIKKIETAQTDGFKEILSRLPK